MPKNKNKKKSNHSNVEFTPFTEFPFFINYKYIYQLTLQMTGNNHLYEESREPFSKISIMEIVLQAVNTTAVEYVKYTKGENIT